MSSFPKSLGLFLLSSAIFFSSCANDNPESTLVEHKIIYDFRDAESSPEVRLSVFVALESKIQMGASMKLVNEDSGLEWNCSSGTLDKIELRDMKWVGSTNFVPVKNEVFPSGRYRVVYEDLAERECESSFELKYPENIFGLKSSEFPGAINTSISKKIAVYSNEDVLLYFGDEPAKWNTSEAVIMDYKNAWCTRVCYTICNDTVYCFMPPNILGNKEFIRENADASKNEAHQE